MDIASMDTDGFGVFSGMFPDGNACFRMICGQEWVQRRRTCAYKGMQYGLGIDVYQLLKGLCGWLHRDDYSPIH